jgi:hypothetical protein
MDIQRIVREGFVAGLIGAVSVAVWFLLVDLVAGRVLFTPAMLGDALFWNVRDPAQVQIAFPTIVGYTMFHAVAFVAVGMIAAALAYEVELFPSTLFIVVVAFAVFEFGFYLLVVIFARPLLGALAWWNVAIGNAIAAAGMGYYLWMKHPRLQEELRRHPLGEPADQGFDEPVQTR